MYVDCPSHDCRTSIYIGSLHDSSKVRCEGCAEIYAISVLLESVSAGRMPGSGASASGGTGSTLSDPGFVIYDLETTGLSSEDCEIIQIAAVRYREGEILRSEKFSTFVRPLNAVPYHITTLTGVTNQDVRNAPSQREALLAFSQFVGHARLIAHNGLRFDSKFLEAACYRERLTPREVASIDSIHLSKRLFGIREGLSHGMDAILARLSLSTDGHSRHDARGDVELLAQMVQVIHRRLELDHYLSGISTHLTVMPSLLV
ncbi:MAG: 3'-5' exonuclease [Verrucomicrobiaceae bacterium]|nr:MAG: 3'-5' exonuclease [Verrucomicrobiaceae bacterium]